MDDFTVAGELPITDAQGTTIGKAIVHVEVVGGGGGTANRPPQYTGANPLTDLTVNVGRQLEGVDPDAGDSITWLLDAMDEGKASLTASGVLTPKMVLGAPGAPEMLAISLSDGKVTTAVQLAVIAAEADVEPPTDGNYMPPHSTLIDYQQTVWTQGAPARGRRRRRGGRSGEEDMFVLYMNGSAVGTVYQGFERLPDERFFVQWGSGAWLDPAAGWVQVDDPTGGTPVEPGEPEWIDTPSPEPVAGVAGSYPVSGFVKDYDAATDVVDLSERSIALPPWLQFARPTRSVSEPQFVWNGTQQIADTIPAGIFLKVTRSGGTPVESGSIAITVVGVPVPVPISWARTPSPSPVDGEAGSYNVTPDVAGYKPTDVIAVHPTSIVLPPWVAPKPSAANLTSLAWDGTQTLGDDVNGVRLGATRDGQTAVSSPFSLIIRSKPSVKHRWRRLDAAASFNAPPAQTGMRFPAFGGTCITPVGDVYGRNNNGDPHWNVFFRRATRTLEGVDATDIGLTHNLSWTGDRDRNALYSGAPAPAIPGFYGHLEYALATNTIKNKWPVGPAQAGDPIPPPYYEALSGASGWVDYFDNMLWGFGAWGGDNGCMGGALKRRNLLTNMNGLTVETLFPGGGFGFRVPTVYPGTPQGMGEYPYLVSGMDSRTHQMYYLDPAFDLWMQLSGADGEPRDWVKIPTFGPRPVPASPTSPEYRRQCVLHEARNKLVVKATNGPSSRSTFTGFLDLNSAMWEPGLSGDASPLASDFGHSENGPADAWYYAGQLLYDRVNEEVIDVVPWGTIGTAFYACDVAGSTT